MALPVIFDVWLSQHRDHRAAPPRLRRLDLRPIEPYGHLQRGGRRTASLVLILIFFWFLSQAVAAAPVKSVRRVLFISSLGPSYPFTARIDEVIRNVLEQSLTRSSSITSIWKRFCSRSRRPSRNFVSGTFASIETASLM